MGFRADKTRPAKIDGCDQKPATVSLPDKAKDGTTIERKTYRHGKDGAEVVLVVIKGGGHTWPGQEPIVGFTGKSTKNISANDLLWEFFSEAPNEIGRNIVLDDGAKPSFSRKQDAEATP